MIGCARLAGHGNLNFVVVAGSLSLCRCNIPALVESEGSFSVPLMYHWCNFPYFPFSLCPCCCCSFCQCKWIMFFFALVPFWKPLKRPGCGSCKKWFDCMTFSHLPRTRLALPLVLRAVELHFTSFHHERWRIIARDRSNAFAFRRRWWLSG